VGGEVNKNAVLRKFVFSASLVSKRWDAEVPQHSPIAPCFVSAIWGWVILGWDMNNSATWFWGYGKNEVHFLRPLNI